MTLNQLLSLLGRRWRVDILRTIEKDGSRYNKIHRQIPEVSHKVLTEALRDLERHGLITRTVEGNRKGINDSDYSVTYARTVRADVLLRYLVLFDTWAKEN